MIISPRNRNWSKNNKEVLIIQLYEHHYNCKFKFCINEEYGPVGSADMNKYISIFR